MKKSLIVLLLLLTVPALFAQPGGGVSPPARSNAARSIIRGGTLPTSCRVGDVYYKTGASAGLYNCTATNTWAFSSATATFNSVSPMSALGDTIYGGAAGTGTRLAGNTTANKYFFAQTGDGKISAAPVWSAVSKSDVGLGSVENTALSTWAGTANITTLGTISKSLTAATGDESAFPFTYTTNKATSGNDTGIQLTFTDTASPGTSYFMRMVNGTDDKVQIRDVGAMIFNANATGYVIGYRYSDDATAFKFAGLKQRGTQASPTAALSADILAAFTGYAYHTDATPGVTELGGVYVALTENATHAAGGSEVRVQTTAIGGTTPRTVAQFFSDGSTYFGGLDTFDAFRIAPTVKGANAFTGSMTSVDMTADRTWTFPNASGTVQVTGTVVAAADGGTGQATFGTWTQVNHSAGNFTASDARTWTVEAGDQTTYEYMIMGKTMFLNVVINTSSLSGAAGNLYVAIPASKSSARHQQTVSWYTDNNTAGIGIVSAGASATTIALQTTTGANWSTATNTSSVKFSMVFEIN